MTNTSLISKDKQKKVFKPFLLRPVGKDYLWGGNRLNDDFSKGINMEPLAETWSVLHIQMGQILWRVENLRACF